MKIIPKISTLLLAVCLNACGEPEQKFRVKVTDESGVPMPDVECTAWFNRAGKHAPLDSYKKTARTDKSGHVELEGETVWYQTSVSADPEGYYKSHISKLWMTGRSAGRWEPWPVEVDLVLKRIRDPHPMYAMKAFDNFRFKIPNLDSGKPVGFDLEVHDWVAPHGRGLTADFLIAARRRDSSETGYQPRGWIDISFPNPADGIQRIEDAGGSLLVGPAEAPENGYKDSWSFANRNEPGETGPADPAAFVFRTRTLLDEEGRVIRARYGKIDGGISSALYYKRPSFTFTYYFNKKSNDKRLEWDRENNLIKGLDKYHWPKHP